MDHAHIDMLGLTDEAEVEHLLDPAARVGLGAAQLAGADQAAILAADADRQRAGPVDQPGDVFVHGAGQHHFHHLDHGLVGHTQAVDEGGLDGQAFEHGVDLRSAAMHHHGVDADLLEQGDVGAELLGQGLLAHGVSAVFHHHGGPGVTAQERQRVGEDARLFSGGGELRELGGWRYRHRTPDLFKLR